jgi:ADP-ribose pyrophosphatase YjhB (NUDIX family)
MNYITFIRNLVGDSKIILTATSVVIVNEQDEVLLLHRSDNHLWGLPGGLMELDESIAECAIREVKEETNLDVALTRFLGVFNNPLMRWRDKDEARVIAFSFAAKIVGGDLRVNDSESVELGFFAKDKLPPIHSADNREAIDAFFAKRTALVEGVEYNG